MPKGKKVTKPVAKKEPTTKIPVTEVIVKPEKIIEPVAVTIVKEKVLEARYIGPFAEGQGVRTLGPEKRVFPRNVWQPVSQVEHDALFQQGEFEFRTVDKA